MKPQIEAGINPGENPSRQATAAHRASSTGGDGHAAIDSTWRRKALIHHAGSTSIPENRHAELAGQIVDADPWMSVRCAALHAGVCEKTIRRAYQSRQIQHTRVGRVVRFRRSWLDEWLLRHQVVAVA